MINITTIKVDKDTIFDFANKLNEVIGACEVLSNASNIEFEKGSLYSATNVQDALYEAKNYTKTEITNLNDSVDVRINGVISALNSQGNVTNNALVATNNRITVVEGNVSAVTTALDTKAPKNPLWSSIIEKPTDQDWRNTISPNIQVVSADTSIATGRSQTIIRINSNTMITVTIPTSSNTPATYWVENPTEVSHVIAHASQNWFWINGKYNGTPGIYTIPARSSAMLVGNGGDWYVHETRNFGTLPGDAVIVGLDGRISSSIVPSTAPIFHAREERPTGQVGGSGGGAAKSKARELNTIITNTAGFAFNGANGAPVGGVKIPANTPLCFVWAAQGHGVNTTVAELVTSDGTLIQSGIQGYSNGYASTFTTGSFATSFSADTGILVSQYTQAAGANNAFGVALNRTGFPERYAELKIYRM